MMMIMAGAGLYQRGLREEPRGMALRIGVAMVIGTLIMATLGAFIHQFAIGNKSLVRCLRLLFCGRLGISRPRLPLSGYGLLQAPGAGPRRRRAG